MSQVVDLKPCFPFTPFEDMKKGYGGCSTLFVSTIEYPVDEFSRFLHSKHRYMSLSEAQATFSDTMIYLLDHGFTLTLTFKSGLFDSEQILQIKVSFFEYNELRIVDVKDLLEVPFIQYYLDYQAPVDAPQNLFN